MKGIKIHGGALFVKRGLITLKLHNGKWGPSPIMLEVLEWDLRTEPPDSYDILYDGDLIALGDGIYEAANEEFDRLDKLIK